MDEAASIGPGPFTKRDIDLMASWYGVDADDLFLRVKQSRAIERLSDDFTSEGWDAIEEAAIDMGGRAERRFDFIEASSADGRTATESRQDKGLLDVVYGRDIYREIGGRAGDAAEPGISEDALARLELVSAVLARQGRADLAGWSMTNLLAAAYLASIALGADPSDRQLAAYDYAMSEIERRCEGQRESLALDTPIGKLVATTRGTDHDTSYSISVDLEKADGTSGQVAMVEVVDADLADIYPCPLHTLCWDGADEDPTRVDCDHEGEMMREVGWAMGERLPADGRIALPDATKLAKEAAKRTAGESGTGGRDKARAHNAGPTV